MVHKMHYHCPICGKETEYNVELEGLCENCYRNKYKVKISVPFKIEIKICPLCGRIRYGKDWVRPSIEKFQRIIISSLKKRKELSGYDISIALPEKRISLSDMLLSDSQLIIPIRLIRETILIQELPLIVNSKKQVCPLCMKKQTGSLFAYVIHIRFPKKQANTHLRRIDKVLRKISKYVTMEDFIDIQKISGGLDIKVSSGSLGRKIVNMLTQALNTEAREYTERKYDTILKKQILIHKVMIEI